MYLYICRTNTHGVGRESLERMLERYQHDMTVNKVITSEKPFSNSHHGNNHHSNSHHGNNHFGNNYYSSNRHHGNSHYGKSYHSSQQNFGYRHQPSNFQQWSDTHTHTTKHPHTHTIGQPQTHTTGQPQTHNTGQPHTHTMGNTQSHTTGRSHTHTMGHTQSPHTSEFSSKGFGNIMGPTRESGPEYTRNDSLQEQDTSIVTAVKVPPTSDVNTTLFNMTLKDDDDWPTFSPPATIQTHSNTTQTQYHTTQTHSHTTQTSHIDGIATLWSESSTNFTEKQRSDMNTPSSINHPSDNTTEEYTSTGNIRENSLTVTNIREMTNTGESVIAIPDRGVTRKKESKSKDETTFITSSKEEEVVDLQKLEDDDLEFLQTCFTNFTPAVLKLLYTKANYNLSVAVDLALHLPTEEETGTISTESTGEGEEGSVKGEEEWMEFNEEEFGEEEERRGVSSLDASFEEILLEKEGAIEEGKEEEGDSEWIVNLGLTEEEYADVFKQQSLYDMEKERKDKERVDKENESVKTEPQTNTGMRPGDSMGMGPGDGMRMRPGDGMKMGPGDGMGMRPEKGWDDSNLLLKLTPSLAKQLQNMFGAIPSHLLRSMLL